MSRPSKSWILPAATALAVALQWCLASEPFLRLRDTNLGYHGPDSGFTNLTEIRIGWFGPTNLDDPLTGDLWWAASLAVREANECTVSASQDSCQSLLFRLVPCWAADPWSSGVSRLTRMVYDEQPLALLGSADSSATHLAEQVVAKANLPLVSPVATDKSITLAGVSWMFCCSPGDEVIAQVLVDEIMTTLGDVSGVARSGVTLITGTDHESRMTAGEVLKEFSRRGCLPALRLEVPPAMRDFSMQIRAVEEARPTALLIISSPEDSARLVRALHVLGNEPATAAPRIFGSHAMSRIRFRELAGVAAEGVCFPLLFTPDPAHKDTSRFCSQFAAERRGAPDYFAALAYDATRLLIEAIRRAGPRRAQVREELCRLSPWIGVAGPIHFDGTGQNTRTNICMATIREGAIVPLQPAAIQNTRTHTAAKL